MGTIGDFRAKFAAAHLKAVNEAEYTASIDGLDLEFINQKSVSNAFTLKAKDLEITTYKNEIRFLIARRYFPGLDVSGITMDKVGTAAAMNKALNTLYKLNPAGFTELLEREIAGLGPGEVILYFLLDNVQLGGGNSAGVDIIDNGTPYEVKAVNKTSDGKLVNFKLGGTVNISDVQSKILKLKAELLKFDPSIAEGEKTGVNNDHMKGFESDEFIEHCKNMKIRDSFKDLNDYFQKIAYDGYFKNHPIIFMGSKSASRADKGRVYDIVQVTKKMVGIHKVTNGTIKPYVKPSA
jgi:hypothetical protein